MTPSGPDDEPQRADPVVIITVGTGRDRADIARGIVFSLAEQHSQCAVFLCSQTTRVETLPLILDELKWASSRFQVHTCTDEDDVQALFLEWNAKWEDWFRDWPADCVVVDFTSGTKPMSAAAFALAIAREAGTASYFWGPRDETGRAVRTTGVRSISTDLIVAHRQLRLAAEQFHAGSFAAARDVAGRYLKIEARPDGRLRNVARSIHFIADVHAAWDRFDYQKALSALHNCKTQVADWPWLETVDRLQDNNTLIRAARECCKPDGLDVPLCADLLGNVERRFHAQEWDDAVARLYRACELIAQIKLWKSYGQRTNKIDPSSLPPAIQGEYEDRRERAIGGKLKLGLEGAFALLEDLGDPLGKRFREMYGRRGEKPGPLQGLLNARNDSLLAHGTVPIKKAKAEALYGHVVELADLADPEIRATWLPRASLVRFGAF